MNKFKPYLIGVILPVLLLGLISFFALYWNNKALGAPAVFIATPATTSATALQNFSFTIGTTTPLTLFGSTTLAVYGSTTIHTWRNTTNAFIVLDSATSTVFRVDTINRRASTSAFVVSNLLSCDTIDTNADGVLACGTDATGASLTYDAWTHPFAVTTSATTSAMIFSAASSTFAGNLSITGNATTTQATTTQLAISGITSSLIVTGSTGQALAYAGASCTNQFIRSLSALGAATCATVVAGDVSLANLTATDGTLTFSGTYNGSTARTIGLNLGNANIWTALQNYNLGLVAASSTFTGNLQIQALFASSSAIINGSSTIQNVLNVGGVDGTASSTFNTGIKIKSGCFETATSSCLTNTGGFTFAIASSTMSTSTRARQFRMPVDFDITKVSCVTYGASAAIQLDERAATTPQTAGTNVLSAALTCDTDGAVTQVFTNRFITQDAYLNLQITDAQPGVARPTILEVHIYGEKVQ